MSTYDDLISNALMMSMVVHVCGCNVAADGKQAQHCHPVGSRDSCWRKGIMMRMILSMMLMRMMIIMVSMLMYLMCGTVQMPIIPTLAMVLFMFVLKMPILQTKAIDGNIGCEKMPIGRTTVAPRWRLEDLTTIK